MNKQLKTFLNAIENETRRADAMTLLTLMEEESGYTATLRGKIIGFGLYHYQYASGREGSAIVTGFSPQKNAISIYIMPGFADYQDELAELGKHRSAKCCLYVNKLADVDTLILRKIVRRSVADISKKYGLA